LTTLQEYVILKTVTTDNTTLPPHIRLDFGSLLLRTAAEMTFTWPMYVDI